MFEAPFDDLKVLLIPNNQRFKHKSKQLSFLQSDLYLKTINSNKNTLTSSNISSIVKPVFVILRQISTFLNLSYGIILSLK